MAAAASALLVALELNIWRARTSAPAIGLILTVAALAVLEAFQAAVAEYRESRLGRLREAIRQDLIATLTALDKLPGLDFETTSVTALLVRRQLRPFFRRYLFSVERLRMYPVSPSPGILWTKGKGIIGLCWQDRNVVAGETGAPWDLWLQCTKQQWKKAPPDVRLGFRYKEFKAIAGKYEAVVVAPIIVKGRFEGCVAVDGRRGRVSVDQLIHPRVADAAQSAAIAIGNLLHFAHR